VFYFTSKQQPTSRFFQPKKMINKSIHIIQKQNNM